MISRHGTKKLFSMGFEILGLATHSIGSLRLFCCLPLVFLLGPYESDIILTIASLANIVLKQIWLLEKILNSITLSIGQSGM